MNARHATLYFPASQISSYKSILRCQRKHLDEYERLACGCMSMERKSRSGDR